MLSLVPGTRKVLAKCYSTIIALISWGRKLKLRKLQPLAVCDSRACVPNHHTTRLGQREKSRAPQIPFSESILCLRKKLQGQLGIQACLG